MNQKALKIPKNYIGRPYFINAPADWHELLSVTKERTGQTKGNLIKEAVEKAYTLS